MTDLKIGDKIIGNDELLDQIQSMQETIDELTSVLHDLHIETYRLSEAYEIHPEIDANGYELSTLFDRAMKVLGYG